ncbi:MAG: BPL-N domain-containing protein, partial [Candidatus Thorarchaeota archaeon]
MKWRKKEFHSKRLLSLCLLSILFLSFSSPTVSQAQIEHDDLTGIKVAIYNGTGVMISSRVALTRMFEWMNASVVTVTASQVRNDFLDDYDIFVVPGGSETTCDRDLETTGKQKVKDFVANGGSYFGICGGATFGALYLLLFNGVMGPIREPGEIIHMTIMNINQSSTGPDLSDCSANCSTMYYASQSFVPLPGTSVYTIATYESNERAGMVACEYENGTVFLSSPHPEYEENDDRDGTIFGDDLDDPDSEWNLLLRVSTWLIEASVVEPL